MVSLANPPPPTTRSVAPRHCTLVAGERLVRIYNPKRGVGNGYNHNGPRSRFDHHCEADPPADDPAHGILYAARDFAGAVVEVFGDASVIELGGRRAAELEVVHELRLLDLTGNGAWCAGSVAALTKDGDRAYTQAWARYFYAEVDLYGRIDGIFYENAHNAAQAVALFERAGELRVLRDMALSELHEELFCIADQLGMMIA